MRHARGFTLIEVMITVAIIAVLASIALPAYTDYIRRGKIPEATSALLAQKTKFEQFFQDNRSYCATAGCPTCGVAGYVTKYFTIAAACATANTFVLRATGGTPSDSSMAGIEFTINEGNAKTTTVTSGSTMAEAGYAGASCWVAKRGGASAC